MKYFYLISLIFIFSLNLSSQSQHSFQIDTKAKKPLWMEENTTPKQVKTLKQKMPLPDRDVDIVNIIDIGTSTNAYQLYVKRSTLWVNTDLNTVSFYHSLMPGYFNFGYDISTDGGSNWDLDIGNFASDEIGARFPNHGIYNPTGNTNPDNAFIVFNAKGFNTENNGIITGLSSIGDTSNYSFEFDTADQLDYNLSGFDITSNGEVFSVSPMRSTEGDLNEYLDSLVIIKGVWNETAQNFDYTSTKIEALIEEDFGAPVDVKIAFAPNGETGYITMLGNNGMADQIEYFTNIYPIYWKTTNGGETWEGPEFIQLDGSTGLEAIVNHHLSDEKIAELFGNNPPARTDISYTTAYDHDITVDQYDNLHIAVVIGPTGSDPYSIITAKNYIAVWDFVEDGDSWCPVEMGRLSTFRGNFGDLTEDNRVQISRTETGEKVFVSWHDTDMEGAEDNNAPNIFCRGIEPSTFRLTTNSSNEDVPTNVTLFSDGMWKSYFYNAPNVIFTESSNYYIPFVYADFDPTEPNSNVQFKYIEDFSFSESDFQNEWGGDIYCGIVGVKENEQENFIASSNAPNPFHHKTTFEIELSKETNIQLKVFSNNGKLVSDNTFSNLPQGKNTIEFNAEGLIQGIYFYTFIANGKKSSGKMMVY